MICVKICDRLVTDLWQIYDKICDKIGDKICDRFVEKSKVELWQVLARAKCLWVTEWLFAVSLASLHYSAAPVRDEVEESLPAFPIPQVTNYHHHGN